ncbi:monocarboxylate transporter 14-like [Haliotis rufescens]|uniref:monocarboxylate transporter 14-like n=1 Tax=Haliotis rufescens TaxID=6454 RepID=UPI00201F67FE|nr:monocarboxylate transporter 14-like [Haliotis rufescens]XP_048247249.1 monocarboxylate transporter 14-like [Haliotis rufescens]XP_048247250.1 monocarboxylate transporter 14-like [Haliotis rufescens]XP_048247251.1 monocarboxylate transporter 14-like [Haliotis rufescens]
MAVHKNIDRGYAWVVLVTSWLQVVISGIFYYTTGVVNTALLENMQEGVVKTSWVGSTLYGTMMLTAPVTSSLTNVFGCRISAVVGGLLTLVGMVAAFFAKSVDWVIVSYGLTAGLGIGFLDTSANVINGHYFQKYLPLASGLQVSGGGSGMLIGAPLVRLLLDTFGLSGTFLLLGAIGANTCVCGMMFRPSPHEQQAGTKTRETPGDLTNNLVDQEVEEQPEVRTSCLQRLRSTVSEMRTVLSNVSFMLYVLSYTLWGFGESIIYVHLPNFAESKGTSQQNSAMLYTAMGITSIIARVLAGFAGNDPAIGVFMLHTGMLGVAGVLIMMCPLLASSFTLQLLFCSIYGIYSGGPVAFLNPIIVDLVGVKQLATGYGMVNFIGGFGLLLGPPFAGFIMDVSGSYDVSFACSGSALVIGSLLSLGIPIFKRPSASNVSRDREMDMAVSEEYRAVACGTEDQ